MPAFIKTKKDEEKWQKAKEIANESGEFDYNDIGKSDQYWAYVTGIYKRMTGMKRTQHKMKHNYSLSNDIFKHNIEFSNASKVPFTTANWVAQNINKYNNIDDARKAYQAESARLGFNNGAGFTGGTGSMFEKEWNIRYTPPTPKPPVPASSVSSIPVPNNVAGNMIYPQQRIYKAPVSSNTKAIPSIQSQTQKEVPYRIGAIPGYSEEGEYAYRAMYDPYIHQAVQKFNRDHNLSGDNAITEKQIKTMMMLETGSGLHKEQFMTDPFQTSNTGDGDKSKYGLTEGVAPGGHRSIDGMLKILWDKGQYGKSGYTGTFNPYYAYRNYNGNVKPRSTYSGNKEDTIQQRNWYANQIMR